MQCRFFLPLIVSGLTGIATLAAPTAATAQAKDLKIAHIYSKTGPLEAYGKQTQVGLMMGLDYATGGTMQVGGRKLVVIEKDDQGKPDLGKNLLAAAYGDDKVEIAVGPTASPVALASTLMTPLLWASCPGKAVVVPSVRRAMPACCALSV